MVCADGGNTDPTSTHGKDPLLAKKLEIKGWDYPKHLAGRAFSVVVHGDSTGVQDVRRTLIDWMTDLHLIQADNAIRQDLLIRNEDELIHAMNHFELRGGGGTDFRPAFEYVNQLCAEKKFSNLRGLLYFTDGMGTYPARRPAYDTAFLFLGEKFDDANGPPWAMKVVLDEDEFSGPTARAASALADALAEEDDPYRELNNS